MVPYTLVSEPIFHPRFRLAYLYIDKCIVRSYTRRLTRAAPLSSCPLVCVTEFFVCVLCTGRKSRAGLRTLTFPTARLHQA